MREKIWKDCPVCGSEGSMRVRKGLSKRIVARDYPPLDIDGLDGQFCAYCSDGFWSMESERKIALRLAGHKAQYDSARVVAAELASVQEAAKAMKITVQGVHKMMKEGRLRYVEAGGLKLPIRKYLLEAVKTRKGKAKLKAV